MFVFNSKKQIFSHRGFTLIELLVVISIIGFLATAAMIGLDNSRKKARDARRLADMKQVLLALNLYYDKYGRFPGPVTSWGEGGAECGGWDSSIVDNDGDGRFWLEPLIDEGFMKSIPVDPLNTGGCNGFAYQYHRYDTGASGCDPSRGRFFVLGIRNMETSSGVYPESPGWSCPGRDWHVIPTTEWVTGGFEK